MACQILGTHSSNLFLILLTEARELQIEYLILFRLASLVFFGRVEHAEDADLLELVGLGRQSGLSGLSGLGLLSIAALAFFFSVLSMPAALFLALCSVLANIG